MVTVCVDAMGGESGTDVVLEGITQALEEDQDLEILVVGNEDVVVPFCDAHDRAKPLVSTEVIEMDEHPATAARTKRDSSIVKGCAAVRHGEADAFFSAGSTGAILIAASINIGRIRGVKRAALSTSIPGASGRRTVMLDMGANANVHEGMIVQFAHMGRAFSKITLGVEEPTVALLSNGSEETKGSEQVIAQHQELAAAGDWFVGNAEGSDLLAGRFDVIVTDGFTGNVALKSLEGTAKYIVGEIKKATKKSVASALGALLLKSAMKEIAGGLSDEQYGGAFLLGLKAPVVIGHGKTSVTAVKNGALACAKAVREGLVDKIAAELESSSLSDESE